MHRILVVDDEEAVGMSISEYFRMQGYEVDYARDRIEAEDHLAIHAYSILIEDIFVSNANTEGLGMVEYVNKRHPKTQIIVLTARDSDEIHKEALLRGAAVILSKPKPLAEIAQVVSGLLHVRELSERRELEARMGTSS